jgi:hypothetical protein
LLESEFIFLLGRVALSMGGDILCELSLTVVNDLNWGVVVGRVVM